MGRRAFSKQPREAAPISGPPPTTSIPSREPYSPEISINICISVFAYLHFFLYLCLYLSRHLYLYLYLAISGARAHLSHAVRPIPQHRWKISELNWNRLGRVFKKQRNERHWSHVANVCRTHIMNYIRISYIYVSVFASIFGHLYLYLHLYLCL